MTRCFSASKHCFANPKSVILKSVKAFNALVLVKRHTKSTYLSYKVPIEKNVIQFNVPMTCLENIVKV